MKTSVKKKKKKKVIKVIRSAMKELWDLETPANRWNENFGC